MIKKVIVIVIVVAIAGVTGWEVYRRVAASQNAGRQRGKPPLAVEVTPVRQATVRDVGVFTGSLLPKSQFIVAPKIPGRVKRLLVNRGDPVRNGQLVAELDDEEYAQEAKQAQAELDVAKANVDDCASTLEVARREFERIKALRAKGIASESELDAAEGNYEACQAKHKVALAQVQQRKAALETAKIRLAYAKVCASWETNPAPASQPAGRPAPAEEPPRVIGERFVDEGALLKVNDPIVSVLEDRSLIAVIHVIERDYPKVKIGQDAALTTDPYPGQVFHGRVVRIAPLLKETSRQAPVEIEVPNRDRRLRQGMFVRASIEFARKDNATVIPHAALVKRDGKSGVLVADLPDGEAGAEAPKARFVPVTLGIMDGKLAEVISPQLSGLIITLGQHLLEDGSPIILPQGAPPVRSATRPASPAAVRAQAASEASR